MAAMIISPKLTRVEAIQTARDIEHWFRIHPRRRICRTNFGWSVHRTSVVADILTHTRLNEGGIPAHF